jgi:microcompartment protein CcmK/EutM
VLLARVVGNAWGAKQAESLRGYRLLVVRPLTSRPAERSKDGTQLEIDVDADDPGLELAHRKLVVVDRLGAGPGELVLVAHGSRCRDLTMGEQVPTKEVVVAIVDRAQVRTGGRS